MVKIIIFILYIATINLNADMNKSPDFSHFAKINDNILNQRAEQIDPSQIMSTLVQSEIKKLLEISKIYRSSESSSFMVGLAAPQVGINKRIILVDIYTTNRSKKDNAHALKVYINPQIIWKSEGIISDTYESCFSAGKLVGIVPRYEEILIRALDENGNIIEEKANGFTARIFQHEIDHLDGLRFPDRIEIEKDLHWVEKEQQQQYREEFRTWKNIITKKQWYALAGKEPSNPLPQCTSLEEDEINPNFPQICPKCSNFKHKSKK